MERAAVAVVKEATVEVVVPVYNEEGELEGNIRRLRTYLDAYFPFPADVTIADNASTDGTQAIGARLAATVPGVRYIRLNDKGRGRAIAATWLISDADVVAYMDVDLATDLDALLPLVAPLISGHSDVAIGSRLSRGARVKRGLKREVISRGYNWLLRLALGARFKDAQCGFKAMRADAARRLVPRVENRAWFFDTELLVLAQRAGLRIHEVPVDWTDDADTRVRVVETAIEDLHGVWRLMWSPPSRFARFSAIGITSTIAYALLYLLLQEFMPAWFANVFALAATGIANTAANRRITFGVRGRDGVAGDLAAGLIAFMFALVVTTAAAGLLRTLAPHASDVVDVAVMTAANISATVFRYLLLRIWMDSTRQLRNRVSTSIDHSPPKAPAETGGLTFAAIRAARLRTPNPFRAFGAKNVHRGP